MSSIQVIYSINISKEIILIWTESCKRIL